MYGVGLAVILDVELGDVELDVDLVDLDVDVVVVVEVDDELVVGVVEVSQCEIVLSSS